MDCSVSITVNGEARDLRLDTRTTLLDALRDHLGVMSVKKGCDHGQCGACTVLLDGTRVLSCLCLAASAQGAEVLTAEGLGQVGALHPLQEAFLDHDGFQCGYCTPGQICSAAGMLEEARLGWPSHVTPDVRADVTPSELSDSELRERMSGNLCRCGAYSNIIAALREMARGDVAGRDQSGAQEAGAERGQAALSPIALGQPVRSAP